MQCWRCLVSLSYEDQAQKDIIEDGFPETGIDEISSNLFVLSKFMDGNIRLLVCCKTQFALSSATLAGGTIMTRWPQIFRKRF